MMNTTSEGGRSRSSKLLLFSFALLFAAAVARAQTADVCAAAIESGATVVTNTAQFASLFDEWAAFYPLVYPYEPATFEGIDEWWVNLNQLTNALAPKLCSGLAAVRGYPGREVYGVTEWPLRLIRAADTGQIVVKYPGSDLELLRVEAPTNYVPFQQYDHMLRSYCLLGLVMNPTNYDALIDQGYTFLDPPRIALDVWLADLNDWPTYNDNVAAELAAEAAAQSAMSLQGARAANSTRMAEGSGGMMLMDSSDPCTITDDAEPFFITEITVDASGANLSWSSCTDHVYVVQATSDLATGPWTDVAWMWGSDQTTTSTDTNAVDQTQQFYRVVRANPTNSNNGIPYGWAVTYGLDPLDPNMANETSPNPWAHGLTNLQVYQNPSVLIADNYSTRGDGIPDWWKVTYGFSLTNSTVAGADPDGDGLSNLMEFLLGTNPNVFDAPMDMMVNGGAPYTPSLTIAIQALTTNYPDIRISTDPLMSNATVLAFSGGSANYALPDNGDGLYDLYLQYADAAGRPHGVVLTKSVTLDRVAPTVYITSPASNALLDQAFITLRAVAADPDPMQPTATRPLKIWINEVPFWDRSGTNIAVERFPVPTGTNSFTVTIQVIDQAGNTNQASQTWTVDTSGVTNAPTLLTVNLSPTMLLPDVGSIWVEGDIDNGQALVSALVSSDSGDVTTNALNVWNQHYEGLVPLEFGTNTVLVRASDAAGNATSNVFTIIRSDRYRFEITSPAFGEFASAPSNYVSGYVSARFDEGLPTETNVTSVFINGVAAVLDTNVDANGNLSFTTTNAIPLGVPITGFIAGPGIPTDPPPDPPVPAQEYEVIAKTMVENFVWGVDVPPPLRPTAQCGNAWAVTSMDNEVRTNEFDLSGGDNAVNVNVYRKSRATIGTCSTDLENDPSIWGPWGNFEYLFSYQTSAPRSLSFGTERSYVYELFDDGMQALDPWPWTTTASLTFRAPVQYDINTTVIFTFEGMDYTRPDGVPLDLSQVKYLGQNPIAWSNEVGSVSYLITVDGGRKYTISQDSFQWPSFTTNYVYRWNGYDPYTEFVSETTHSLSWTDFHNAKPEIVGSHWLVSTTDAAGSNVTLTATNYPSGGTFQWSTTSTNINLVGSTTSSSLQVSPIQAKFTPPGSSEVVTLICTFNGGSITNTFKIVVQKPTSLGMQLGDNVLHGSRVTRNISYQVLDQNGKPIRQVINVGGSNVRIANLLASETLAWQCNTSCNGAQAETHNFAVYDDGTFPDTQSAGTTCSGFVRSQVLYVGILTFSSQDIVGYKCICFDGSEFRIFEGAPNGGACCSICGQ